MKSFYEFYKLMEQQQSNVAPPEGTNPFASLENTIKQLDTALSQIPPAIQQNPQFATIVQQLVGGVNTVKQSLGQLQNVATQQPNQQQPNRQQHQQQQQQQQQQPQVQR